MHQDPGPNIITERLKDLHLLILLSSKFAVVSLWVQHPLVEVNGFLKSLFDVSAFNLKLSQITRCVIQPLYSIEDLLLVNVVVGLVNLRVFRHFSFLAHEVFPVLVD